MNKTKIYILSFIAVFFMSIGIIHTVSAVAKVPIRIGQIDSGLYGTTTPKIPILLTNLSEPNAINPEYPDVPTHGIEQAQILTELVPNLHLHYYQTLPAATFETRDLHIAKAVDLAAQAKLLAVNISMGKYNYSPLTCAAIARHPQTIYVIGAGNDGSNNDVVPFYPASCPGENIISVGASSPEWKPLNYGAHSVDVFAVAVSSSQATAMVTAEVAKLRAKFPRCNAAQIKSLIIDGVDKHNTLVSVARGTINEVRSEKIYKYKKCL